MKLLLDTHILIWALADDPKLPKKARELILDVNNAIYVSTVSLWEVVVKHSIHPNEIPYSGKDFYDACRRAGFELLEAKPEHVLAVEGLRRSEGALPHKDPFDRLLIAQAKTEEMRFVTHDALLSEYGDACVISV